MTTKPAQEWTVDDLDQALIEICEQHPDTVNPVNDFNGCLYTDREDPDRHCLIGQFLADHDFRVPSPDEMGSADAILFLIGFPPEICHRASRWQRRADNSSFDPIPWGHVLNALNKGE